MNARESILKKLGDMGQKTPLIVPPKSFSFVDTKSPSLLDQFRQAAQSNGIDVALVDNSEKIPALIKAHHGRQSTIEKICIAPALSHLPWEPFETFYFGSNDGSYLTGINCAQGAVAQTGALVFVNHPDNPSSISFLSKEHFIILHASDIRASMSDMWKIDFNCSNAIHLIAGLSSTADIAGKLLIGVHGPEKLTCIVVATY